MARLISRDPFARTELVRDNISEHGECSWCGQPARYRYAVTSDDRPLIRWMKGIFCSIQCCRIYHDLP